MQHKKIVFQDQIYFVMYDIEENDKELIVYDATKLIYIIERNEKEI